MFALIWCRKHLHPSERELLKSLVDAIDDEPVRSQIQKVISKYRRRGRSRNPMDCCLHYARWYCVIWEWTIRIHKRIPALKNETRLSNAKIKFADGSSTMVTLWAWDGGLKELKSKDARVSKLFKHQFDVVSTESLFDPTWRPAKVQKIEAEYLHGAKLEPLGWERRSIIEVERIDVEGKNYIALAERGEEMLFGRRGKLYVYNFVSDNGEFRPVTLDELTSSEDFREDADHNA